MGKPYSQRYHAQLFYFNSDFNECVFAERWLRLKSRAKKLNYINGLNKIMQKF